MCFLKSRKGLDFRRSISSKKTSIIQTFTGTRQHASNIDKLRQEEVSIDWAHRVLINNIRQQRMLRMMTFANDRNFSYQNENDLVDFIASEMQKEGFGPNNEENIDSYLNTKFM